MSAHGACVRAVCVGGRRSIYLHNLLAFLQGHSMYYGNAQEAAEWFDRLGYSLPYRWGKGYSAGGWRAQRASSSRHCFLHVPPNCFLHVPPTPPHPRFHPPTLTPPSTSLADFILDLASGDVATDERWVLPSAVASDLRACAALGVPDPQPVATHPCTTHPPTPPVTCPPAPQGWRGQPPALGGLC